MDNNKKLLTSIFIFGCINLGLPSCGSGSSGNTEDGTTYVTPEYIDSMNITINTYTAATQEQRETLFHIMKELDEIADEAFALGKERLLKGQVEDMRMVDKVKYRLATVQTELNQARNKALENPGLVAAIDNLKHQIAEQEDYINNLRKSIQVKEGDLQKQRIKLEEIVDKLECAKADYENSNARLIEEQNNLDMIIKTSWSSVGDKLVDGAEQVQLVKNHGKLVNKTKEAKKRILRRAIECYNKAAELGEPIASQKAKQVEIKIQNLNNY